MGTENLTAIVEQPFDWVGSVLVPVAAVLVSAGIAIGLAARERRAAQKDELRAILTEVVRKLYALNTAGSNGVSQTEIDRGVTDLVASINVLELHLQRRDWPLPDFLGSVIIMSLGRGSAEHFHDTAGWLMNLVYAWERGEVTSKELAEHMPMDTSAFHSPVDPAEWKWRIGLEPKPASKTPPGFYDKKG